MRVHSRPGANLGFTGGYNAPAPTQAPCRMLFLNPGATPAPDYTQRLREAAGAHPTWGAWQALVALPGATQINTSGGVTHYLGFAWAGECDAPLLRARTERSASPRARRWSSGATCGSRSGLRPELLHARRGSRPVAAAATCRPRRRLARAAVVEHDYDFDKGSGKWFLLERNRWLTLLAVYLAPLLLALAPALLATELALLAVAARGGWLPQKLRAQRAVIAGLPATLRRRREVQATRRAELGTFAHALTAELDSLPADRRPAVDRARRPARLLARRHGAAHSPGARSSQVERASVRFGL